MTYPYCKKQWMPGEKREFVYEAEAYYENSEDDEECVDGRCYVVKN